MKRRSLFIVGGLGGAAAVAAGSAFVAPGPAPSQILDQGWNLVWREEFHHDLDPAVWVRLRGSDHPYRSPFNPDLDASAFDPDYTEVRDGKLRVRWDATASLVDGQEYPYTTGIATTAAGFAFQYGLCEFRAWIPTEPGISPAVWMLPMPVDTWPPEIDIAEWGWAAGAMWAHLNVHWEPGPHGQIADFPAYATAVGESWHTYTLQWEPDLIRIFYDGQLGYEYTGTRIPQQPMYLVFSGGVLRDMTPRPGEFLVDYVRVWQR